MNWDDPASVAAALGISPSTIQARLNAVRLSESERQMLKDLQPTVKGVWPSFIQRLHRQFRATPSLSGLLQQESRTKRLVETQWTYLEELFGAPIDEPYVLRRLAIGLVHHRLRITPQWYLSTYAHFLCGHLEVIFATADHHEQAIQRLDALHKSILFDAALALDAYGRRADAELLGASGAPDREVHKEVSAAPSSTPTGFASNDLLGRAGITRIHLSEHTADQRADYLGLTRSDLKNLRALRGPFDRLIPGILQEFYEFIQSSAHLSRLVRPEQIAPLTMQVVSYWKEFVEGNFDRSHAASRMRIGVIHESIGLDPQWYLVGLGRQVSGLLRGLPADQPQLVRTLKSFFRAIYFDITFVIDAYMESRAMALLHVRGYANQLMAGLASAVVVLDHLMRVQFANESFIALAGMDRSLLYQMPLSEVLPQEDVQGLVNQLRQDGRSRVTRACQLGGAHFRVTAMVLEDSVHVQQRSLAVVFDDVSEMIRLSDTIEQDAYQYKRLTKVVTAVLWEMDWTTQTIHSISYPTLDLIGYRDVSFLGRANAWMDRIVPEDRERVLRVGQALEVHQRASCEYRMRHADGRDLWVYTHMTRLASHPKERRIAGVTLDVSDAHQSGQLRLAALEDLTGGLSHVINNALTSIAGNIELHHLLEHKADGHEMGSHLHEALDAVRRVSDVVHQMLAFSGSQLLRPQEVSLNDLVRDAMDLLRLSSGSLVQVETDYATDLWSCRVDPVVFVTSMRHLCDNARQAMPVGGKLLIQTCNRPSEQLTAQDPGFGSDWVEIMVRDNGSGMSDVVRQLALVPFYTTASRLEHYGLGLSMVHGFVTQSGGHVQIFSEPGQGTDVTLRFPCIATTAVPVAHPAQDLSKPTVLVVDGDESVRRSTASLVQQLGLQVVTAPDADHALQTLQSHAVDLMVVDASLGSGAHGVSLAERIVEQSPHVAILITSGGALGEMEHEHLRDDWALLRKPYTSAALSEQIRTLLQRRLQRTEMPGRLSDREREVLHCIAAGKTQAQVGQLLGISDRTVEQHIRSARRKLKAENTVHAVVEALAKGEIRL